MAKLNVVLSFSQKPEWLPRLVWLCALGVPPQWIAWLYLKLFCKIRITDG